MRKMTMEKIVVYPYDVQFSPILRHRSLLKGMEIVSLVSPKGWGMNGQDASRADGGINTGITINTDFRKALSSCDTVLFTDSQRKLDINDIIYPKIKEAIGAGKNIICTLPLQEKLLKEIAEECSTKGLCFKYCNNFTTRYKLPIEANIYEQIYEMTTPVIFVLGMSERTSKFNIQLSLRENLLRMGYKISQVGSRNDCELLGFHSMPSFMFSDMISAKNKILLFNNFIKNIEIKEEPDVIIIGVPGGIMSISNIFTQNFGTMAYEISHAVTPDAAIVSLHYEAHKDKGLNIISNISKYSLGFEIDCFNMGNVQIDWGKSNQIKEISHVTVDSDMVDRNISNNSFSNPVYNILNPESSDAMVNYIIDKIAKPEDAECL